ncbi:MAG: orotidine-5'-phosphate decarboxylase [Succinivibrionaceae bacterium]|nr:orotidine-5'-phosphate decarboxylase [Succinivibrionaceae bacterium]
MATDPRVFVALDYPSAEQALGMASRLDPARCGLKVGKELFTAAGPGLVEGLCRRGYRVFLDLKYHDIPHTVARAVAAAASLGVFMVNVHALGGRAMLSAAAEALAPLPSRPLLIAVTVLTSMSSADLAEVGIAASAEEEVGRLAALAHGCGLDGVVCSAREVPLIKSRTAPSFVTVTPGIRPAGSALGDQQRVATPAGALALGADCLVIGRPITAAADPLAALAAIEAEIAAGAAH